jgi:hypothetical protein
MGNGNGNGTGNGNGNGTGNGSGSESSSFSDLSSYFYLLSPQDKDTVDSPNPMLVWGNTRPLSNLSPGEYFRIVVVALSKGQGSEAAVVVNTPQYFKNYLKETQVQYPYDAPALESGKHYGWQVQLLNNGVIVNKTEAWEFIVNAHTEPLDNKYARLRTTLDASAYLAVNNRIFFRFDETYAATDTKVRCTVLDTRMKPLDAKTMDGSTGEVAFKKNGFNQYEVDLKGANIKSGYYYLQVSNGKGQNFMLKFQVE